MIQRQIMEIGNGSLVLALIQIHIFVYSIRYVNQMNMIQTVNILKHGYLN
jgi:hypothetical protein